MRLRLDRKAVHMMVVVAAAALSKVLGTERADTILANFSDRKPLAAAIHTNIVLVAMGGHIVVQLKLINS